MEFERKQTVIRNSMLKKGPVVADPALDKCNFAFIRSPTLQLETKGGADVTHAGLLIPADEDAQLKLENSMEFVGGPKLI